MIKIPSGFRSTLEELIKRNPRGFAKRILFYRKCNDACGRRGIEAEILASLYLSQNISNYISFVELIFNCPELVRKENAKYKVMDIDGISFSSGFAFEIKTLCKGTRFDKRFLELLKTLYAASYFLKGSGINGWILLLEKSYIDTLNKHWYITYNGKYKSLKKKVWELIERLYGKTTIINLNDPFDAFWYFGVYTVYPFEYSNGVLKIHYEDEHFVGGKIFSPLSVPRLFHRLIK